MILALSLALYLVGPWLLNNWICSTLIRILVRFITLASGMRAAGAMLNLWALASGHELEGRAHLRDLFLLYLVYVLAMLLVTLGSLSIYFSPIPGLY